MRRLIPAALLAACTDYNVGTLKDPNAIADTGAPPVEEDPRPEDTGTTEEVDPEDTGATGSDDGGGDGGGDDGASTDTGDTGEPDPEDDPAPADDCADTEDLIYLLDQDENALYLFDPATTALTPLGTFECDYWTVPSSMAVSRDGIAYIRHSDDTLWALDLATFTCTDTGYAPGSFGGFGMGFATDTATTWRETLYLANRSALASLDTTSFSRAPIGGLPSQSELTGNAAGELWGVFPLESPARVRRLDPTSGAALETRNLSGFPDPTEIDTFAFAAWNGDLFIFVRTFGVGNSTDVYRVGSTGTLTRIAEGIGINAVGAGVSTCAPDGT